jgi:hypothetical protein
MTGLEILRQGPAGGIAADREIYRLRISIGAYFVQNHVTLAV